MANIWDSIKNTTESLGGALWAPQGAVLDLASMPFNGKDDDFGTAAAIVGRRASDVLDPVMNPNTATGSAIGGTLTALNWALTNGVSEPIATAQSAFQHAAQQQTLAQRMASITDGASWAKAYEQAQHQNAGQALTFGLLDSNADPFQYSDPYAERTAKEHTVAGPALSWGMNIAGSWFLDPGVLAGKGLGAARSYRQFAKLSQGDRARIFDAVTQDSKSGLMQRNLHSRTDKYLSWINGQNSMGRPLEGPEILFGTPELRKYAAEPHVIAGLLADASKLGGADAMNAQRRILAVAAGDPGQIARLRGEIKDSGAIADALTNSLKGGVLDLKALADNPTLQFEPGFIAHLEGQLKNLNSRGEIDKFMDGWNARQELLLGTQDTLTHLPGFHAQGSRAVNRLNDTGLLRAPKNLHEQADAWVAKQWESAQGSSTLYQQGLKTVPLLAVKAFSGAASIYTKAPVAAVDALRQAHFTGVAHLHDWGGATTQLDSMMRLSKVAPGERMKALSEAYLAKTEVEKMRAIDKIENISMRSMASEFSARSGREIDRDYIDTLMSKHAFKRGMTIANMKGRSYAATEMPDALLAQRGQSMANAESGAMGGKGFSAKAQGKWRVDQIADDGMPLSLPLLETQLTNTVPLLDMGVARKLLERDNGYLSRLSRSWKADALELQRLNNAKAAGAKGLDAAIDAKAASIDWLVQAGQKAMKVWKFSVLFRLGYPMRVLMDDHWRIWTQMKAGAIYGDNGKELLSNVWHNGVTRRTAARMEIHTARVKRQELIDELEGDRMVSHIERQDALKKAQRALKKSNKTVARLTKQLDGTSARADGITIHVEDGVAWASHPERGPIGEIRWNPKTGEIDNVGVLPEFRRKGIASDLLREARRQGRTVNHSAVRTNAGEAWARSQGDTELPARKTVAEDFAAYDAGVVDRLSKSLAEHVSKPKADVADLKRRLAEAQKAAADQQGAVTYFLEQLGERGPDDIKREIAALEEIISGGVKLAEKRRIGSRDFVLDAKTGAKVEGAFGGLHGTALRDISSSKGTFDAQMSGVEDHMYSAGTAGSHRTIQSGEPGHLDAWADVLNHQFRQSPAAMHFINGGDLEGFVKWVKSPEQAQLRQRLAHFAHDPEDWGGRVRAMVHDYIPSEDLRAAIAEKQVSARQLAKMFSDPSMRPAVHGRAAADNLGISERTLGVGKTMNHIYKFLGEMPTDRLSRHPFFNSLYKQHAQDIYEVRKIAYAEKGQKFTQQDFDDIAHSARKLALNDVKRTLFDISAHSHAAHVMRFISPFFAAHQESIARWWRIVGDDPSVVRRFAQAFDVPRHLNIVVDENGDLVPPGAPISRNHHILLQLPKEFGGPDPTKHQSSWSISENAFNIVLQGGLTNPGVGPIVSLPVEYLARKYADEPEVARIARVFNPYPPQSPMESVLPATLKRAMALGAGARENPRLGSRLPGPLGRIANLAWKGAALIPDVGVGQREYNDAYSQHVQDLVVDFRRRNGREPSQTESQEIMLRAGREASVQMFHRLMWNALSPAPATPNSKYSLIQHGWYQIAQQARTEGHDFEWAYAQFKDKWGEAYMPLVYSAAENPAHLDSTTGTVAALKKYRGVLNRVDPALSRAVIGGYADDLAVADPVTGEFSTEAQAYLRSKSMRPGSPDKYFSYSDPRAAMEDQMARRGWQKYGELTGALTAQAQQAGLNSYMESPLLVAIKRAGLVKLQQENWAFAKDYGSFDSTQFDRYLNDMRTIVASPSLSGDAERTDIQTLGTYLKLRDLFVAILGRRKEAGFGGPDAQANLDVRTVYTQLVGKLVESNTYFETNIFNGLVDRDPLLVDGAATSTTGGVA